MRTLIFVVSAVCFSLSACSTAPIGATPPLSSTAKPSYPSIATTSHVLFLGERFTRKWQATDGPVKRYEYYPVKQTPDDWLELTEFQVYTNGSIDDTPSLYAKHLDAVFKAKYPGMPARLYANKKTGEAILVVLYPTSLRKLAGKKFVEFDAFKYFQDPVGKHVICFHYAKNIEAPSSSHPASAFNTEITKTWQTVLPAMALFKPYRE